MIYLFKTEHQKFHLRSYFLVDYKKYKCPDFRPYITVIGLFCSHLLPKVIGTVVIKLSRYLMFLIE